WRYLLRFRSTEHHVCSVDQHVQIVPMRVFHCHRYGWFKSSIREGTLMMVLFMVSLMGVVMKQSGFKALVVAAMLAALVPGVADAKKKNNNPYGLDPNDQFQGIMSPSNKPKASDPLWEHYAYAGKKALERFEIDTAQKFYWATCIELEDVAKENKSVT